MRVYFVEREGLRLPEAGSKGKRGDVLSSVVAETEKSLRDEGGPDSADAVLSPCEHLRFSAI